VQDHHQGRFTQNLYVYLLATSYKNYWLDIHEDFTTDVFLDKQKLLNFGGNLHQDLDSGICLRITQFGSYQ